MPFWSSGSPALRNAMATSLVLLFVFLAAPRLPTAPFGVVSEAPLDARRRAAGGKCGRERRWLLKKARLAAAASAQGDAAQDAAPAASDGVVTQSAELAPRAAGDAAAAKGAAATDVADAAVAAATEAAPDAGRLPWRLLRRALHP